MLQHVEIYLRTLGHAQAVLEPWLRAMRQVHLRSRMHECMRAHHMRVRAYEHVCARTTHVRAYVCARTRLCVRVCARVFVRFEGTRTGRRFER